MFWVWMMENYYSLDTINWTTQRLMWSLGKEKLRHYLKLYDTVWKAL